MALGKYGFGGARYQRGSGGWSVWGMRRIGREAYALLEADNLLVGQGVRLGDDGNQVHLGVEAAHNLDIDLLEPVEVKDQRTIWNVGTIWLTSDQWVG